MDSIKLKVLERLQKTSFSRFVSKISVFVMCVTLYTSIKMKFLKVFLGLTQSPNSDNTEH